jgi:hypothetical protein
MITTFGSQEQFEQIVRFYQSHQKGEGFKMLPREDAVNLARQIYKHLLVDNSFFKGQFREETLEQIMNQEVASLYTQVERMEQEHLHKSSKDNVLVERRIKTRKASLAHLGMDFQMLVGGVMEGKILCVHADGMPTALEYIRPSLNRQFCVGAVNKKKIDGVWTEEANYETSLETDGSYLVATYGSVRVFDMKSKGNRSGAGTTTEYEAEGGWRHARELADSSRIAGKLLFFQFNLRHSDPGAACNFVCSHRLVAIVALNRSESNLWESPLGKRWLQNN